MNSKTGVGGAIVIAAALAGGFALLRPRSATPPPPIASAPAASSSPPPAPEPPPPPPAGPAELALIAPLAPGAEVTGWALRSVTGVHEGAVHLTFEPTVKKDKGRVEVLIALDEDDGPNPPAVVGRYALYYSARRVEPDVADALTRAVAAAVEKNKQLPPPAGMTPYRPSRKPAQTL